MILTFPILCNPLKIPEMKEFTEIVFKFDLNIYENTFSLENRKNRMTFQMIRIYGKEVKISIYNHFSLQICV